MISSARGTSPRLLIESSYGSPLTLNFPLPAACGGGPLTYPSPHRRADDDFSILTLDNLHSSSPRTWAAVVMFWVYNIITFRVWDEEWNNFVQWRRVISISSSSTALPPPSRSHSRLRPNPRPHRHFCAKVTPTSRCSRYTP